MQTNVDVVTGAFSYTGRYIAQRLLVAGRTVRTLTNHPERPHRFGAAITAYPYSFDRPEKLASSLRGAETLYCTYWIRYPHGTQTYEKAIQNSDSLFQAAKEAGIRRIVHVSIANPSLSSPLGYYSGKARVEEALQKSGVSYAILRPTVVFGREDILINNIAWMIRHFPIFAVPGDGTYKLQPIYVEDFADALVAAGNERANVIRDAVGPETFSFDELLEIIARELGKHIHIVHAGPTLIYCATSLLGQFLGDIILTREEIQGLMDNLLASKEPALGKMHLSTWIKNNKGTLGKHYASEIKRHF